MEPAPKLARAHATALWVRPMPACTMATVLTNTIEPAAATAALMATHGDALGKSISYEKGRGVQADEGVLEAAFTGNHGWYWRNRGQADVKVVLRTRGDYTDIKRGK